LRSTQEVLAEADVVVVPSIWGDACPSTVSEALASGKALVASRAGGIPEMLGDSGCAILVPPGDEKALSGALEVLIQSGERRAELGRLGRRRVEEALEWNEYVETVVRTLHADCGVDYVPPPGLEAAQGAQRPGTPQAPPTPEAAKIPGVPGAEGGE
jgi:glycosyltransferase involved in cell wall biosynthesis